MSRFTTILWDVDDTLLDFSYSQRQALTACFRSLGREITEEELCLYGQDCQHCGETVIPEPMNDENIGTP